jgi:hypothetical protein
LLASIIEFHVVVGVAYVNALQTVPSIDVD